MEKQREERATTRQEGVAAAAMHGRREQSEERNMMRSENSLFESTQPHTHAQLACADFNHVGA